MLLRVRYRTRQGESSAGSQGSIIAHDPVACAPYSDAQFRLRLTPLRTSSTRDMRSLDAGTFRCQSDETRMTIRSVRRALPLGPASWLPQDIVGDQAHNR